MMASCQFGLLHAHIPRLWHVDSTLPWLALASASGCLRGEARACRKRVAFTGGGASASWPWARTNPPKNGQVNIQAKTNSIIYGMFTRGTHTLQLTRWYWGLMWHLRLGGSILLYLLYVDSYDYPTLGSTAASYDRRITRALPACDQPSMLILWSDPSSWWCWHHWRAAWFSAVSSCYEMD